MHVHVCVSVERAIIEGETIIQDSLDQFDNPHHTTVTCTAGKLLYTKFLKVSSSLNETVFIVTVGNSCLKSLI